MDLRNIVNLKTLNYSGGRTVDQNTRGARSATRSATDEKIKHVTTHTYASRM
jgi:hypothetical protein